MTPWIDRAKQWLPAAAVGFAAVFSLRRLDDFDTWWHLAAGRWIYENGTVPGHDVLSYTVRDHAWTNLQWLYDLILFGLYSVGGADLLVLACAACFTGAAALLARNLRLSLGPVGAAVLLVWVLAAVNERFLIRPEMATFVLLQAVLLLLATMRENQGRFLWMLVPVMALWVNLHALFVLGAAVIVAAMCSCVAASLPLLPRRWREASELEPQLRRRLLLSGATALLATLANPYFVDGALFPLELLTRIDGSNSVFQSIGEFRPPFSGYFPTFAIGAYQAYFFAGIAVVALAGLLEALPANPSGGPARASGGPARFNLGEVAVFVSFAYLSLLARRNAGIFVIATAPFVACCASVIWDRTRPLLPALLVRRAGLASALVFPPALLLMSCLVASNWWYVQRGESHASGFGVFEANFPLAAADFVRDNALPGRLYNDFTAGGYLTWARPAGDGVYIDGRLEVYDQEFFTRYSRSLSDARTFEAEVDRLGIETVLLFHRWGNRHPLIRWLARNPAWDLVFHDPVGVVFLKGEGNQEALARARQAFPAFRERTEARLVAAPSSWRAPVSLHTEILAYAGLMETLGDEAEAFRLYGLGLTQGVSGADEARARLKLAVFLARRGELGQSRLQVLRALEVEPQSPDARRMLEQLERHGG